MSDDVKPTREEIDRVLALPMFELYGYASAEEMYAAHQAHVEEIMEKVRTQGSGRR